MTPRSIRRAAERKDRKQARKTESSGPVPANLEVEPELPQNTPEQVEEETVVAGAPVLREFLGSPARLAANRANAQQSTGPTTAEGKATSSKNALKTALTGRTVLLPGDDAERYGCHLAHYGKAYRPLGERECELVQFLADTTWRLDRIAGLEYALYAKGSDEFTAQVSDLDPDAHATMLRLHTYLAYERQFRNLNIQEMRLQRQREKLIVEVKQLQKEREQREKDELDVASKLYIKAKTDGKPFDPADHGFEISTADVEAYLEGIRAAQLTSRAAKLCLVNTGK
jgi:hypothetical protein